jgi:L-malate glycosyltransferase
MSNVPAEEKVIVSVSFYQKLRQTFWHIAARGMLLFCLVAVKIAGWIGRKKRTFGENGGEIMLTGRFDSKNWILAHLVPLAQSKQCSRLWMVSTNPVPDLPKVFAIYPPKWLIKIISATPARLLTYLFAALRKRPHFVGGFHILFNGIAAIIVGRLAGARSMYFCVGGPAEIKDGGVNGLENSFRKMETPDVIVERRLLKLLGRCDTIVTMGSRAAAFFRDKEVNTAFHIVSGGIDSQRFQPAQEKPSYDFIMTGRLVEIKRIDIFLQAVKIVAGKIPEVKALIIGDGPLRENLEQLTAELGIEKNINFAGFHNDIENWLRKSKIFVLTSDSEGLSLSLMEAMMCGLPAVVSDVGDLADLVHNDINGYLVPRRSPQLFAERLMELLKDVHKLEAFSKVARLSALRYDMQNAIKQWDGILVDNPNKQ